MRVGVFFFLTAVPCLVAGAPADSSNLEGGVFIAHYPAAMQFSSDPPPEGWCQHYLSHHAIDSCGAQVNRIDTYDGVIWFVLAAWSEAKQWCGTEFGLGSFDPGSFEFTDYGPCYPDEGLEIPTDGWPGPGEGTAFVTTTADWDGNLIPVYYFCGYAYSEDLLSLSADPATGFGGMSNCLSPPESWSADAYGGMGLFTDGVYACPEGGILGGGSGGGLGPQGSEEAVCCFEEECRVTTREICEVERAEFHPELTSCEPNPCGPIRGRFNLLLVDPEGGPGTYPDISSAVDAATSGDIIEIVDGEYTGRQNCGIALYKRLTFQSRSRNPESCFINCEYDTVAFSFESPASSGSTVSGIGFRRGYNDGAPHQS